MKSILLYLLMLGLSILGARLSNSYIGIICILYSCFLIYFLVKGKLGWPKVFLFCFGLSLLYQTTLVSNYLIGTDIHGEYYYAWLTLNEGWDPSRYAEYNMALGSTLLPPAISWLTGLDLYTIFKWIMPIFLALVPVVLYLLLSKYFKSPIPLLSCIFFIVVPTFSMELTGISKQMVGELFLVLTFLVLLSPWKLRYKIPLLILLTVLTVVAHYSMGVVLCILLAFTLFYLLILDRKLQTIITLVTLVVCIATCGLWFTKVSGGRLGEVLSIHGQWQIQRTLNLVGIEYEVPKKELGISTKVNTQNQLETYEEAQKLQLSGDLSYWDKQEEVLRSAVGFDLFSSGVDGFIFRIIQYTTQAVIVIGGFSILVKRKRYHKNYVSFFLAGSTLLACTVFLPGFSPLMNASRFYHLSLIAIAPAFILGIQALSRKHLTSIYLVILLPYFLFCSGAVYEIEQSRNIDGLTIPYSKGLSGERTGLVGVFTDNDVKVRDYAVEHNILPICSDFNGTVLLIEKMGGGPYYLESASPKDLVGKSYLYLTERTSKTGEYLSWKNTGTRRLLTLTEEALAGRQEIYREGDSVLYAPKE